MAIDLEALRRKLGQLNGTLKKSKVNYWRPVPDGAAPGVYEFNIRVLPWPNNDGQPFRERWFYYNIGKNSGLLAPTQFQKADPFQELIDKLHSSGKKEDREVAKKLYPKMRSFVPIIVRGAEEQGVLVWSFGKEVYQRLIEFMLDAEVGDFTNVDEGYDLKVKVTKQAGKTFLDTVVDAARKPSKLFADQAKVDAALASIPNMDDYQKLKTYDELKVIIDEWARGDTAPASPEASRTSGEPQKDALDKLTDEIAEGTKKVTVKDTPSVRKQKAAPVATVEEVPTTTNLTADLDSVFDELTD